MSTKLYPQWFIDLASRKKGKGVRTARELLKSEQLDDKQRLSILLHVGGSEEAFIDRISEVRKLIKAAGVLNNGTNKETTPTDSKKDEANLRGPRESAQPKGKINTRSSRSTSE